MGLRIVAGKAWFRRLRSSGRAVLVVAFVIAAPRLMQAQGVRPAGLPDGVRDLETVDLLTTPGVDAAARRAEDQVTEVGGGPVRFAVPFAVELTPAVRGSWEVLAAGR